MHPINTKNAISSITSVNNSTDPVLLAAENGNRVGLLIYNNSTLNSIYIYVNWTEDTSNNDYSFVIPPQSLYEMPYNYTTLNYYGRWSSGGEDTAKVTEISDR